MPTDTAVPNDDIDPMVRTQANDCIRNHVIAAMGVGLVPSFLLEAVGVTGIEVKMIRDLAEIYRFPVPSKLVAYKVLISLIGSVAPFFVAAKLHAAVKTLPIVGHATYIAFLSTTNGAAVFAVGKIFQRHYESGGTFLSSDKTVLRKHFRQSYDEGKNFAHTLAPTAPAS
ncbi:YcjF family protein [Propionivibrio sp.]|uniref:YcjF family protein n=1 Tax=Propionivibrio sp. TaxID=2212460 RepID=UPI003BF11228